MIIKKFLVHPFLLLLFFLNLNVLSDEVQFFSSDIEITNNGNFLQALNSEAKLPSKKIEINSDKARYTKLDKMLILNDNIILTDNLNDILIKSNYIEFDYNKDLIKSQGTEIEIKNKYLIKSNEIFFDRKLNKLYGSKKTIIEDNENNTYELFNKFNLDTKDEIIKSKKSIITDQNGNKYEFENLIINIKKNEIIEKKIKVDFINSYFGNNYNDPILKGRGGYSNQKELRLYKAIFSTCNTENKKCRGWELISEEFNHNKTKKLFEYKNSWLKIFGQKIFYLPYFNHPDPTVKENLDF